jgi:serine/threonine protein phosphatase PrpC
MANDGFWDALSNEEAMKIAILGWEQNSAEMAVDALMTAAKEKWSQTVSPHPTPSKISC